VQDVGYRLFLLSRGHRLKGFGAANVGEDLIVLIECDEQVFNKFIQTVKVEKPPSAEVSELLRIMMARLRVLRSLGSSSAWSSW
jgi:acylphosphatase